MSRRFRPRMVNFGLGDPVLRGVAEATDDNFRRLIAFLFEIGGGMWWPDEIAVPRGWVRLDGQRLAIAQYTELFKVYRHEFSNDSDKAGNVFFGIPDEENHIIRARGTLEGSETISSFEVVKGVPVRFVAVPPAGFGSE